VTQTTMPPANPGQFILRQTCQATTKARCLPWRGRSPSHHQPLCPQTNMTPNPFLATPSTRSPWAWRLVPAAGGGVALLAAARPWRRHGLGLGLGAGRRGSGCGGGPRCPAGQLRSSPLGGWVAAADGTGCARALRRHSSCLLVGHYRSKHPGGSRSSQRSEGAANG
jgi:hypothetical protein